MKHFAAAILLTLAVFGGMAAAFAIASPGRRAPTWTHPHAFITDPDSGAPHERMPWVEVYRYERGGVLNKARVWGWTEAEAMADAKKVAEALGYHINPDDFHKECSK